MNTPFYKNPEQIARRMWGLEHVFEHCRDRVVWDIGCAEGEVSGRCLAAGAAHVTGVEKRYYAAEMAKEKFPNAQFVCATAQEFFLHRKDPADIILLLGCLHKMSSQDAADVVRRAFRRARSMVAIRAPEKYMSAYISEVPPKWAEHYRMAENDKIGELRVWVADRDHS